MQPSKILIDLSGPNGNAFYLMGQARILGKELFNWDKFKTDAIISEMMSGDYENLIDIFDREFSEFVELINK